MRKFYLIVAGALLFLLAACMPGTGPTVRTKLPAPINFQVADVGDGYHVSWMYIADLEGVSAFNLYREETFANASRLGAENRMFRVTWASCEDDLCLTISNGDVDESEAQPIASGTLECNATGCYFGYTDTEGLNLTSTYRYYLRMVNADGGLDNQIIITEEEQRLRDAAEEAASQPADEGPGDDVGEPEDEGEPEGEGEPNGDEEPEDEGEPDPTPGDEEGTPVCSEDRTWDPEVEDCVGSGETEPIEDECLEDGVSTAITENPGDFDEDPDPCADVTEPPMTEEECEGMGEWNGQECFVFGNEDGQDGVEAP